MEGVVTLILHLGVRLSPLILQPLMGLHWDLEMG
jgi:hypothetical protein